ncbi:MAG: type III polyketide synthase [Cytophagales bacterium]|nr:type III polyketide synthase [Bernardetiaceae bacterium]MDW8210574.1 type III polyketide synthase [Cytophagales bacterium]
MRQPHITALGVAVPAYLIKQEDAPDWIATYLALPAKELRKLKLIYRASGIDTRYSVIPDFSYTTQRVLFPLSEDLEPFPTTAQRMQIYQREALPLALQAIRSMNLPKNYLSRITHLIVVSCTGMYAPGLEIDLINALSLTPCVQRLCVHFMGCYAAFSALKIADAICRADPQAKVLIADVELCTLHFQKVYNQDQLLANALFADGAAAALVECVCPEEGLLSLEGFYSTLVPAESNSMAWHISDHGFQMQLSSYVPYIIGSEIYSFVEKIRQDAKTNFDYYAFHPGGKKILLEIEQAIGITAQQNSWSYQVMRHFGNMSSATIFFVLQRLIAQLKERSRQEGKTLLAAAFGPGLVVEAAVMQIKNLHFSHA